MKLKLMTCKGAEQVSIDQRLHDRVWRVSVHKDDHTCNVYRFASLSLVLTSIQETYSKTPTDHIRMEYSQGSLNVYDNDDLVIIATAEHVDMIVRTHPTHF